MSRPSDDCPHCYADLWREGHEAWCKVMSCTNTPEDIASGIVGDFADVLTVKASNNIRCEIQKALKEYGEWLRKTAPWSKEQAPWFDDNGDRVKAVKS